MLNLQSVKFIHDDIYTENIALSYTTHLKTKTLFEYFQFCKDCRLDEDKCGYIGKYYEYTNKDTFKNKFYYNTNNFDIILFFPILPFL